MFRTTHLILIALCTFLLASLWHWTATHENRARMHALREEVAQMREDLRAREIENSGRVDKLRAFTASSAALGDYAVVHYELVRRDEILIHFE